ncbi:hypothetical protein GH714_023993 [Hevea brasiliensis]|uniref:EF-hand domain-containing protein n=1 Tax=Hevea brasiliensis TaxID=3981 RepID=A0A6A6LK95_HEVBR|nr:hypothetical protein GH714_023993 [Hevea brasiliensis]
MGNASSMLTQYDIEEVQRHCHNLFSQQEIVSLYKRFCQLDRNAKGFISADEFLSVPEFAMNPLSQRLLKMVDGLNFKDFVAFLSAFSAKASLEQKVGLIFKVYDSDGNGKVSFNDILEVLQDLSGSFMSDEQRQQVLCQVLKEAGYTRESYLMLDDFIKSFPRLLNTLPFPLSLSLSLSRKAKGRSPKMFSVSFDTAVVSGNMERQRSSRPGSEILYALQKLKEILQQKNKQFALFELDVHSSQNNLSAVKSMKSNASSSKHKAIDELRLVEEISENFTGADAAVKKEERGMHKVINGEKLLTDSRARSSNGVSKMSLANTSRGKIYRNSHEGKQVVQGSEIEQLRAIEVS